MRSRGVGGAPLVAVAAVAASQAADVATTFVGLTGAAPVRESNPVAAAAIAHVGVPAALLALGAAAVVAVTAATEAGAALASRADVEGGETAVRATGYGAATALNLAVAAHNATILAAA